MTSKLLGFPSASLSEESAKINYTNENAAEQKAREANSSQLVGLDEVKKVAERLKLNPRRASITNWMEENQNGGFKNKKRPLEPLVEKLGIIEDSKMDSDLPRFSKMSDAIDWIKNELVELRMLDHQLARQLIDLRDEINRMKLHKSCTEHQALLDDVTLELEEQDELPDLCDLIPFRQFTSPLRDIGITRMNLNARRFSMS